jgi:hypothetical protein
MASTQKGFGGVSILLKLLIAALAAVLFYAVSFPRQQWDVHAADQELARERMSNLYNAGLQFYFFNKRFPLSIEEALQALDTTFVEAAPFAFVIEQKIDMELAAEHQDLLEAEPSPERDSRLARVESLLRDSLLVTLEDTMRVAEFVFDDKGRRPHLRPDSSVATLYTTLIWARMKPLYEGLGSDTLYLLSEEPIQILRRKAGTLSRDLWAATSGRFLRRADETWFVKGPTVRQPVRNFSYTLPLDEIGTCPATGQPFRMKHINKYSYKGNWLFTVDGEEGDPLDSRVRQHSFLNEVKALAADGIGAAFAVLTDSAAAAGNEVYRVPEQERNAIVLRESLLAAGKIKTKQRLLAERDNSRVAGADSIDHYAADQIRAEILFPEYPAASAEQLDELLKQPEVRQIVERTRVVESYEPVKVDTVGLYFASPITGDEQYYTGLKHLFEVDPPENHGSIYNGTKSWE